VDIFDVLKADGVASESDLRIALTDYFGSRFYSDPDMYQVLWGYRDGNMSQIITGINRLANKANKRLDLKANPRFELARLKLQIKNLQKDLERLESIPTEPESDDDGMPVVSFTKMFGRSEGTAYHFAAIKANGFWHVTGNKEGGRRMSWAELVAFVRSQENEDPEIWYMSGSERVS